MDYYKIWGQIQEMPGRRFFLTAAAAPVTSGRPACFTRVVGDRVDATLVLRRLMDQLEHQVRSQGDRVVSMRGMQTPLLSEFHAWEREERADGYRRLRG
jgi:hypothetical protein